MITLDEWLEKAKETEGKTGAECLALDTTIYIVHEDDGYIADWALHCGQITMAIDDTGNFYVCDDWIFHDVKDCFWNKEEAEKRSKEIKEAK